MRCDDCAVGEGCSGEGRVHLPIDADKTTRLGITNVVQIPPELLDPLLADHVECTRQRHGWLYDRARVIEQRDSA